VFLGEEENAQLTQRVVIHPGLRQATQPVLFPVGVRHTAFGQGWNILLKLALSSQDYQSSCLLCDV
jgi:hypothetical protein